MRRFSAEYLADTRRGLWADRDALAALDLPARERIIDVGCGTGALAEALREESDAEIVGVDADLSLLRQAETVERIGGDATELPIADDAVDLAACQALLVNLPRPVLAVRELSRVSSALVAAIEPDNTAVTVESSVDEEASLAATARAAYLAGVDTDAGLGAAAAALFEDVGLESVETTRHDLVRETTPPYAPRDLEAARRKVQATRLRAHERELRTGGLAGSSFEALVEDWKAMGRTAAEQLQAGEYRRTETVPFFVTVGRVPAAAGPTSHA